jgi:hypothetical protein
MTTLKQFMANRRNAQQSSGPTTPEGKARSSANAFRHGLRASKFVTVLESTADFEELRARVLDEWKPRSISEEIEVNRLARIYWQRERAEGALAEMLNTEICGAIDSEAARQLKTTRQRVEKLGRPRRGELDAKERRKCLKAQRQHENIVFLQDEAKKTVRNNSFGVGAALCRLAAKEDKLSILMRYMTHWEREAQRVVQNLKSLKAAQDDW